MEYQGKAVVEGIGMGKVQLLLSAFDHELEAYEKESQEAEKDKLQKAIEGGLEQIDKILDQARNSTNKDQIAIMEAHVLMMHDPMLQDTIDRYIEDGLSAPEAILKASDEVAAILGSLDDPYIRERAADVKDVGNRIIRILLGIPDPKLDGHNIILCGEDIEPSVIANLSSEQVVGIVMGSGSDTSHSVIIAKSKGIVTIVGIGEEVSELKNDDIAIVDGYEGKLLMHPDEATVRKYEEALKIEEEKRVYYLSLKDLPAVTMTGREITLATNIGNPKDIDDALKYGGKGVGLFRTEFVFMGKKQMPTEEEQFEAYRYVVERSENNLCVIRTMDIGGDKPLSYLDIGKEENPFLGWRAIRICLERTDIFLTQIKAILRASAYGKLAIMLPMIIGYEEVIAAKALIVEAKTMLDEQGQVYDKNIEIGIMIETPAAVIMSDELAKEMDFFSIGTNDLVQYTLAVDRGNQRISHLYDHFNPAVLRSIKTVIDGAHKHGKWVGICGEMAGDPLATKLLVEMGVDELSMSGPSIPKIKEIIRKMDVEENIVEEVLKQKEVKIIRKLLAGTLLANIIK
ncbi:MAG: phosphoenolpyruvate--protein phosphotransferase [Firmicutes bacterium HGW-Firmicutes-3]|jgi:phosphotransferase system enzyme I (PtsI)|nr:MAG: phosphoenolpyruvate--protein phosphotransferase [Firmicutes bacterium HGW-Firmicutes-3]